MRQNRFRLSEEGHGCFLHDSGFLIEDCRFLENGQNGLYINNYAKPPGQLGQDVKLFIEKFPLATVIKQSEFSCNKKNGLFLQDYWKGPIVVIDSKF